MRPQKCFSAVSRCVVKRTSTDFHLTQKIAQLLYPYRWSQIERGGHGEFWRTVAFGWQAMFRPFFLAIVLAILRVSVLSRCCRCSFVHSHTFYHMVSPVQTSRNCRMREKRENRSKSCGSPRRPRIQSCDVWILDSRSRKGALCELSIHRVTLCNLIEPVPRSLVSITSRNLGEVHQMHARFPLS